MSTVIVLQKGHLGWVPPGHEDFATEMLERFLHTLENECRRPSCICLYTEGVRAACQNSSLLLGLQLLAGLGVRILICRTCLEHFGLQEQLAVGQVVTMADIVDELEHAQRVLYP